MIEERLRTTCCIAGGGPAGMMLGLLLARAGVDVVVLEQHDDFLRDFRGDTIHPSTIDLIDQLGLRDAFDAIPHTEVRTLDVVLNGARTTPVDFGRLRHGATRLALMPQWDLLELLATAGARLPNLQVRMGVEAQDLLRTDGRVTGVVASGPGGGVVVEAALTVAADGRGSRLREASGIPLVDVGVPIDVLWFRLPRPERDPPDTIAYVGRHGAVVTIPREGYYQAALLIEKGGFPRVREEGLAAFRRHIDLAVPFLAPVTRAVTDWEQVKLLSVQVNHLTTWHLRGFLAIGDAAHAMSPAFGVGVNLAIQDAVATANALAGPLLRGLAPDDVLAAVQRRREASTLRMQRVQLLLHRFVANPRGGATLPPAAVLQVVLRLLVPVLRPAATRLIGRGLRPERIRRGLLRAGDGR